MSSPEQWLSEMKKQAENRERNIQLLRNAKPYDESRLRSMDSSLKKVTAFTKKLKSISAQSAHQLLPELDKLNLSKYLDEIATNICEAKLKTSDLESVVAFCAKLASLYREFPSQLVLQFRKQMPTKKTDRIENPSKLRVDLRLFTELLLNGLFEKDGMQLLGAVLSYLVQTDKQDHVNVSVLLPFCRVALFPIAGIVPLNISQQQPSMMASTDLLSSVFTDEKRNVVGKLITDYWDGLVVHTTTTRQAMNKLRKHIKRQERTRGDASADDRQRFDTLKALFERLSTGAVDIGECVGRAPPEMPAEPSDDEREEAAARQLGTELSEGRASLWPDRHSQLFYDSLVDVAPFVPAAAADSTGEPSSASATTPQRQQQTAAEHPQQPQHINESIDTVDLSCLEQQQEESGDGSGVGTEQQQQDEELVTAETSFSSQQETAMDQYQHEAIRQSHSASPSSMLSSGSSSMHELLERLPNCINRDLIDAGALDFLRNYARSKTHRKRLVQHFLQAPVDRLDLLPFYARFLATVRPAYPDLTMQVLHELLLRFRIVSGHKPTDGPRVPGKKVAEVLTALTRLDAKLHLCTFLAELCKFCILPKAEALTCLRQLLVSMRGPKVDMLSVFVEHCGPFLHRSPDAHAKMSVIMQVMRDKSSNIEDARQKILLENAYYAVIPPDEQASGARAVRAHLPPEYEFVRQQLATEFRVNTFRRMNWSDPGFAEFAIRLLSNAQRVQFDELPRLASLVSALSDHHDWVGVRVLDEVLEFIRLSMELNMTRLQQRTICSVAYFGQLFNYNVCNTATLFKALYQLITFAIAPCPVDGPGHLVFRLQRIRLAITLVDSVCEFFVSGKSKRRMDHFLCFFFRFYYETREAWSEHIEVLDEFPEDVENLVDDVLNTWRKGEHFPKGLAEAHERVAEVEQFYKAKVDELLANMRSAAARRAAAGAKGGADESDEQRRLEKIMEEEDDEEDEDEEEENMESLSEDDDEEEEEDEESDEDEEEDEDVSEVGMITAEDDDDEAQHIRVRTQQQQVQPEDEDFMRDFDRLMVESLQSAPPTLHGPMSDLAVPPLVRQKFERKLKFADPAEPTTTTAINRPASPAGVLTPSHGVSSVLRQQQHHQETPRMALMLRASAAKGGGSGGAMAKAGGVQLKAVHIAEEVANMDEKWRLAQEARERDRMEMKKVTLAMNERISADEEAERRRQIQQKLFTYQQQSPTGGGGFHQQQKMPD
ncbi:hypothetical protein niasHS_006410 [Heterodera schachtii]|uniref:MIF4G domain-containing protein n=1 Tax=Heterodera schachtii TaxID=97005 RepID=A0ABD2JH58_HETSC